MSYHNLRLYGEIRKVSALFIPCHTIVAGYNDFTLVVRVSVHLSYVHLSVLLFPDNNLSKCQWI